MNINLDALVLSPMEEEQKADFKAEYLKEFKEENEESFNIFSSHVSSKAKQYVLIDEETKIVYSYVGSVYLHTFKTIKNKTVVIPYITGIITPEKFRGNGCMKKTMELLKEKYSSYSHMAISSYKKNLYYSSGFDNDMIATRWTIDGIKSNYITNEKVVKPTIKLIQKIYTKAQKNNFVYPLRSINQWEARFEQIEAYREKIVATKNAYLIYDEEGNIIEWYFIKIAEFLTLLNEYDVKTIIFQGTKIHPLFEELLEFKKDDKGKRIKKEINPVSFFSKEEAASHETQLLPIWTEYF